MKVLPVVGAPRVPRVVVSPRASFPARFPNRPRRWRGRLICRAEETKGPDVYDLQAKLDAAVASEDYSAAAELRDAISDRLLDVQVAVELANRHFYTAFQSANLTEMRSLWSQGDHVQCIHPSHSDIGGHRIIGGYDFVMQSWEAIFSTIPKGDFRIELDDLRIHIMDRAAVVHCLEIVHAGRDAGRIQATNVFECVNGKWLMIVHHGSPAE